jgi:type IV pilus assembly protein PilW
VAISLVVVVLVGAAVESQQSAYQLGLRQRAAQGQSRQGLLQLERALARAGYGVDPAFAFDFAGSPTPCPAEMGTCPPDATANADELVFHSRNPRYYLPPNPSAGADYRGHAWRITNAGVTDTAVTIDARAGNVFARGQILQAVCSGGEFYAYFTVGATTTIAAAGVASVPLAEVVDANPFRRQDLAQTPAAGAGCFSSGTARLFEIQRFRYHVRPVAVPGTSNPTRYVPYLMLDTGTDVDQSTSVDANDEIVIAEGVENMQVAYVLANGTTTVPATTVGATPGTGITFAAPAASGGTGTQNRLTRTLFPGAAPASGLSQYQTSSYYTFSSTDAARRTDHQANIRAVQLALVVRSPTANQGGRGEPDSRPLNFNQLPAWISGSLSGGHDGFPRATVQTTVSLQNMTARGLTYF